ncbi:MAG: rod shape-determining protein MreC [Alphaproteobacteria bacterium]|nr:rod shape-determining protein MreC [Alphaproteobacteria bacterium]
MRNNKKKISGVSTGFIQSLNFSFDGHAFFLVCSAVLLIFGLARPEHTNKISLQVVDIVSPAMAVLSFPVKSLAEAVGNISNAATIRAENVELKLENERLREWYQVALMLEAENQSLKELLSLEIDPQRQYVAAYVLSDAATGFTKSIIIASKEINKVNIDQAVLAGDGLVGRIISVGQNAARVLLINDVHSRVPVVIEGGQQKAILSGNGGAYLDLKYLSAETILKEGKRVVTSGHGAVFPKGLPVGVLFKNKKGMYQVKPYTDINRVSYVRVIQSENNAIDYE